MNEHQQENSVLPAPFIKVEVLGEQPDGEGTSLYNIAVSFFGVDEDRIADVLEFTARGMRERDASEEV